MFTVALLLLLRGPADAGSRPPLPCSAEEVDAGTKRCGVLRVLTGAEGFDGIVGTGGYVDPPDAGARR